METLCSEALRGLLVALGIVLVGFVVLLIVLVRTRREYRQALDEQLSYLSRVFALKDLRTDKQREHWEEIAKIEAKGQKRKRKKGSSIAETLREFGDLTPLRTGSKGEPPPDMDPTDLGDDAAFFVKPGASK